jgi:hypothetical protein
MALPLHWAGVLPDSLSPIDAYDGAVIPLPCRNAERLDWSILLIRENLMN